MSLEPNAAGRLRQVLNTTSDLLLRMELQQVLESATTMSFVPSVGLRNTIAGCNSCRSDGSSPIDRSQLCESHRARFNLEICADRAALQEGPAEHLDELMRRAMASGELGTEFLTAFRRQAQALDAVWEAYRRGAAHLPDTVASNVERALVKVPRILGGAPQRMSSVA
jgi:hypothetical protein